MKNQRAGLAFIFVTLLIDVLGFGLLIPVLPQLVESLTGGGVSTGAHYYGLLLATFGLMQFLFSPVLGGLSDRYGRRPVLLVSLFFTTVDYAIMAKAPSIGWLFFGRVLSGITGASFTAASAYIADVSPPEKRAQNFGLIGAAFGAGFILGPALGGVLAAVSLRAPFWAAAGISLLNCLYGAFVLPESLSRDHRRPFSWESLNPVKGLGILTRFGWVEAMAGALVLVALAQQALQSTWVLYTTYRYGWTERDNGLSLALIGLASGVVQVALTRLLVQRIGERRTVLLGMAINAAGFLAFGLATAGWMVLVISVLWCLGGVAGPTTQSLISKRYADNEQGAVQGALTSLQSLCGIVGPVLATWVFGYFTAPAAPVRLPGAPLLLGAALVAVAAALALRALRQEKALEAPAPETEEEIAEARAA